MQFHTMDAMVMMIDMEKVSIGHPHLVGAKQNRVRMIPAGGFPARKTMGFPF